MRSWRSKKAQARRKQARTAVSQSHITFGKTYVFASVTRVNSPSTQIEDYFSLLGDNLTYWVNRETQEPSDFERLKMYTTINLNTLQMAYTRIGVTRITYVRQSGKWEHKLLSFPGYRFILEINFLTRNTKTKNIQFTLSEVDSKNKVNIDILFNGSECNYIDSTFSKESGLNFKRSISRNLSKSEDILYTIFDQFFGPVKFKELGRSNKNIKTLFPGDKYKLGLITFHNNLFLTAEEVE